MLLEYSSFKCIYSILNTMLSLNVIIAMCCNLGYVFVWLCIVNEVKECMQLTICCTQQLTHTPICIIIAFLITKNTISKHFYLYI